jgi:transposase
MFISDAPWEVLKPVLEVAKSSVYGRPRANAREVFEAILFVLHTGIQRKYLPKTFLPKSTVHDYLQFWSMQQAFRKLLALVIRQLVQKGLLTRWGKNLANFSSFTLLGCLMLTLRHLPFS